MSGGDVLRRAAIALRESSDGSSAHPGLTRARVMASRHRRNRRRLMRWAVLAPLLSLLVAGGAWAQSAGKWQVVWQAVASVLSTSPGEPVESDARRESVGSGVSQPAREASLPDEPDERKPEEPESEEPDQVDESPVAPEPPPTRRPPPTPARPARSHSPEPEPAELAEPAEPRDESTPPAAPPVVPTKAGPSTATSPELEAKPEPPSPPPEPPSPPPPDPELALFRAAHDQHFSGGSPRAAIDAYAEYLRRYPRGRFVPEAKYNLALGWLRLGARERARRALEPFAEGRYGEYRKREARELLEALR